MNGGRGGPMECWGGVGSDYRRLVYWLSNDGMVHETLPGSDVVLMVYPRQMDPTSGADMSFLGGGGGAEGEYKSQSLPCLYYCKN